MLRRSYSESSHLDPDASHRSEPNHLKRHLWPENKAERTTAFYIIADVTTTPSQHTTIKSPDDVNARGSRIARILCQYLCSDLQPYERQHVCHSNRGVLRLNPTLVCNQFFIKERVELNHRRSRRLPLHYTKQGFFFLFLFVLPINNHFIVLRDTTEDNASFFPNPSTGVKAPLCPLIGQ